MAGEPNADSQSVLSYYQSPLTADTAAGKHLKHDSGALAHIKLSLSAGSKACASTAVHRYWAGPQILGACTRRHHLAGLEPAVDLCFDHRRSAPCSTKCARQCSDCRYAASCVAQLDASWAGGSSTCWLAGLEALHSIRSEAATDISGSHTICVATLASCLGCGVRHRHATLSCSMLAAISCAPESRFYLAPLVTRKPCF